MNRLIVERVGAFLEVSGMTRKAFAKAIGINTRESLNNKLQGRTDFTFSEIVAMCDLIGCTPNDLRPPKEAKAAS